MSVLIKYKPSVFKEEFISKEMEVDFLIETLKDFRLEHREDYPDMFKERVCIFINDEEWDVDSWNGCMLEDDDTVEVIPEVRGGRGGFITAVIGAALIATGLGMAYIPAQTAAWASYASAAGAGMFSFTTVSGALVLTGTSMLLSGVSGMLLAPKPPSLIAQETSSDSPSYTWEGPSLLSLANMPIPVVYGEVAVGGNIISQYISNDGSDSYLNLLIALSEGPIEGIMKSDGTGVCTSTDDTPNILINDQPYSVYEESEAAPAWDYRLGNNDQTIIGAFKDIHTYYEDGRKVTRAGIQYTTNGDSLNAADVHLYCPALYRLEGETLKQHTVPFEVEYSGDGGGTWTIAVGHDIITDEPGHIRPTEFSTWTEIYKTSEFNTGYNLYNHVDVRVSYDAHNISAFRVYGGISGNDLKYEDINLPSGDHKVIVTWRTTVSKEIVRIEAFSGTLGSISGLKIEVGEGILAGATQSQVEKVVSFQFPSAGEYVIRVRRMTDDSTDIKIADDLYWKATDEIINSDLTYPNTALLYLRIKASEVISGAAPNVVTKIRGKKVRVPLYKSDGANQQYNDLYWNDASGVYRVLSNNATVGYTNTIKKQWTQNPVYCTKDFLTNSRYGLGEYIATTALDNSYIDAAAKHAWTTATTHLTASEHKFHLDISIDNDMDAPTAVGMLAKTFRGWAVWSEGTIKLLCDKAGTPVQLFTMGNIIKDSFSEQFAPHSKIPNVIECQFANKDRKYNVETREVVYETDWVNGKPRRVHKEDFRGITRESQVLREGKFFLNCARLRNKSISFRAGLDSIHAVAGDLVNFQHDVNKWGYGGRITRVVDDSTIIVDATFTATTNGVLFCAASDGVVQEYGVTASPAGFRFVTNATLFSPQPRVNDVWAYGKRDVDVQTYRILSVSREENDEVGVTALEYNASVYIDSHVLVASPRYDKLITNLASPCPPVASLTLTELTDRPGFVVGFVPRHYTLSASQLNYIPNYSHAEVWVGGRFYANDYGYGDTIVAPVAPGITYDVKVYSVNTMNVRNVASPAVGQIVVENFKPPTPTGLKLDQDGSFSTRWTGKHPKFTWNRTTYTSGIGNYGLGWEPAGLGQWSSIDFDDNYRVEIWKNATLYRTETVTDNFYTYTYEFNKSDFGNPASSFDVRVYGWNDRANLKSDDYAELEVSNKVPDAVSGLTSAAAEDALIFSWNNSEEKDFSHYRYRYRVATSAGVYSAYTSWSNIPNNEVTVNLNVSQIENQDSRNSRIWGEFATVDLYNDVSSTVSNSASTLNLKKDLVVSPISGQGMYTTIASAVAALPSTGGAIALKAGVHNVATTINLPNANVIIQGSGDGTIVTGSPRAIFFNTGNSSYNSYVFRDFVLKSTNATSPWMDGIWLATCINTNLVVDNVKFILQNNNPTATSFSTMKGDKGVFIETNFNEDIVAPISIKNCTASGGLDAFTIEYSRNINVENNYIHNVQRSGVYLTSHYANQDKLNIQNNTINQFRYIGIYVVASPTKGQILGNTIAATMSGDTAHAFSGILTVFADNTTIADNFVKLVSENVANEMDGIVLNNASFCNITDNTILLSGSGESNNTLAGIHLGAGAANNWCEGVSVLNNNITITTDTGNMLGRGIILTASRCNISNNYIRFKGHADSTTAGVVADGNSGRIYGENNVVVNADNAYLNTGDNCTVTGTIM